VCACACVCSCIHASMQKQLTHDSPALLLRDLAHTPICCVCVWVRECVYKRDCVNESTDTSYVQIRVHRVRDSVDTVHRIREQGGRQVYVFRGTL